MAIRRSTFIALVASVFLTWAHLLHDASLAGINHGIQGSDVICNFSTGVASGVGAGTCIASPSVCNGGTTDNTAAFQAFVTWATVTWQASHTGIVGLLLPAATCKLVDPGNITFAGIKNLLVLGYGTTLIGDFPHVGVSLGEYADAQHSVRFNTVSKGASSITINPSIVSQPSNGCQTIAVCAAVFTVGQWAYVGGIDLENGVGFPISMGVFQFVKITSINSSTGAIGIDPPLRADYKSTWPTYNTSTPSNDHGGPATLFALHSDWDSTVEWRGITFNADAFTFIQYDFPGRQATFRDVTCSTADVGGRACFAPTVVSSVQFINVKTPNASLEADKEVETWSIVNSSGQTIGFQSAGTFQNLIISGSTYGLLDGTPSTTTISSSNIASLVPGATNFGASTTLNVSNSIIGAIPQSGVNLGGYYFNGSMHEGINDPTTGWSMAGGIITIPNSYILATEDVVGWAVPNANICWADDTNTCARIDQITDLTQDATNTYVHTTAPGGFPYVTAGKLGIRTHPMPQVTFTGVTGSPDAVWLSLAPAGAPLFSYAKQTITGVTNANPELLTMWGNLKKLTINVGTPYTGMLASTNTAGPLFGQYFNSSTSAVSYTAADVQLKSGGVRTLDASGGVPATWTGTQSGDTLTTLSQQLWAPTYWRNAGDDISSDPSHPMSMTVEVITMQNVVVGP